MVDDVPESSGSREAERIAQHSDTIRDAWSRTLHDMEAMAADREDKGFETLTVPTGDTAPLAPGAGDSDRFGLSYMIPDNKTDRFEELYEAGDFEDTGVYQTADSGHVFIVTEHLDLDSRLVIYFAGAFQMRNAAPLVRAATERGAMYTHVRTFDRTYIGTFEHEDVGAFFPDPQQYYAYEQNW